MYKTNFEPLLNIFVQEMNRLKKFYLSWSGRLAAYKMLLLPKLLYYFRALPIQIPSSFYKNYATFPIPIYLGRGKKPDAHMTSLSNTAK